MDHSGWSWLRLDSQKWKETTGSSRAHSRRFRGQIHGCSNRCNVGEVRVGWCHLSRGGSPRPTKIEQKSTCPRAMLMMASEHLWELPRRYQATRDPDNTPPRSEKHIDWCWNEGEFFLLSSLITTSPGCHRNKKCPTCQTQGSRHFWLPNFRHVPL